MYVSALTMLAAVDQPPRRRQAAASCLDYAVSVMPTLVSWLVFRGMYLLSSLHMYLQVPLRLRLTIPYGEIRPDVPYLPASLLRR